MARPARPSQVAAAVSARRLRWLAGRAAPGSARTIGDDDVERVVVQTLETIPAGATHWSTRSMAKACGLSAATVSRIWRAFGLKPHRCETFKLSRDSLFIEKVRDVVGLYLARGGVVRGHKPQIQALERRSDASRPRRAAHPRYRRHGTTSLFAALDVATEGARQMLPAPPGGGVPQVPRRHAKARHSSGAGQLRHAQDGDVHDWLAGQPRYLHFTPTSASWINQVERWFAAITERQIWNRR